MVVWSLVVRGEVNVKQTKGQKRTQRANSRLAKPRQREALNLKSPFRCVSTVRSEEEGKRETDQLYNIITRRERSSVRSRPAAQTTKIHVLIDTTQLASKIHVDRRSSLVRRSSCCQHHGFAFRSAVLSVVLASRRTIYHHSMTQT